jgi:hypothetical protein
MKLCGCDYTVVAVCVSTIWMMLCKYTGGSIQRRDIVIIFIKPFHIKYGRKVVIEGKIYVIRTPSL